MNGDLMSPLILVMYREYNLNPSRKIVGDCVIRAIGTVLSSNWEDTYVKLSAKGLSMHDMPNSNVVWHAFLKDEGYVRRPIPNSCPDCYTVRDFCIDYPYGAYVLGTGSHVIAVINGDYYDTWDSGDEVPVYFWERR